MGYHYKGEYTGFPTTQKSSIILWYQERYRRSNLSCRTFFEGLDKWMNKLPPPKKKKKKKNLISVPSIFLIAKRKRLGMTKGWVFITSSIFSFHLFPFLLFCSFHCLDNRPIEKVINMTWLELQVRYKHISFRLESMCRYHNFIFSIFQQFAQARMYHTPTNEYTKFI